MWKLAKILTTALSIGGYAMPTLAQQPDATQFTNLTSVHIAGKGSRTAIITDPSRAPGVTIHEGDGLGILCSSSAEFSQEGGVLSVDIHRRGLSLGQNCSITVELVIPQSVAVSIDQPEAVVELTGSFTQVDIDVPKVTVTFNGSADTFALNGEMGVVDAVFATTPEAGPDIDINVSKLVADVGYTQGAGLDYNVSAPVAMFSRRYPHTPGAIGKMTIKSKLLKGSVYPVVAPS